MLHASWQQVSGISSAPTPIMYNVIVACRQWTSQSNTNVDRGLRNAADSLTDCRAACINNSQCTGLDWNPVASPGSRCWLSGYWSGTRNIGTWPGVTHYDLNRNCTGKIDVRHFWGYPLLSRERVKLRTSNFVSTLMGSKKWGKSSRGRSQEVPKIFRAPIYRAHRAVIFAIAQLSCIGLLLRLVLHVLCLFSNKLFKRLNVIYIYCCVYNCTDCSPWTSQVNTYVDKAQRNVADTLSDCQAACVSNSHCTGLSWNPSASPGVRCWLDGPWSGRRFNGSNPDITHYDLNRKCLGNNQVNVVCQ